MLKIKENEFREKFVEIDIRQRIYQKKSFLTFMITVEFFPSLVEGQIVSGSLEVKLDVEGISSLDGIVGRHYQGDIGSMTISVNNDGVWEHQSYDNFLVNFEKRDGRDLKFEIKTEDCILRTTGVLVSLYTTSSSEEELSCHFDLKDFYDKSIIKEINGKQIRKYFVKE